LKTDNTADDLRRELQAHGAREFEVVALAMDSARGLSALHYALAQGAEHPIAYAIKVFDNPDWQPSGERPRRATNLNAPATVCATCGGDRFVVVSTRPVTASVWMKERGIEPPAGAVEEEWGSCPECNPQEVSFWRADGSKFVTPDAAKVRELLGR
jgi:hypothetical protein